MATLPITTFIVQYLSERYPDRTFGLGTPIYDLIVMPTSQLLQRFRDELGIVAQSSMANLAAADPDLIRAIASNFSLSYRQGTYATGTQRIYLSAPVDLQVPVSTIFTNPSTTYRYSPVQGYSFSKADVQNNYDAVSGRYWVDVAAKSVLSGTEYIATSGTVTRVAGATPSSQISATTNVTAYAGATDSETSYDLYDRLLSSLSDNTLVSRASIAKMVTETFQDVSSLSVVGYGDAEMIRDKVGFVVNTTEIYPDYPCSLSQMWLTSEGEVTSTETAYGVVTKVTPSPGISLPNISSPQGIIVTLQAGHYIKFTDYANSGLGLRRIRSVASTYLIVDGELNSYADSEFKLYGWGAVAEHPIGGKVDVYVDGVIQEYSIIVNYVDSNTLPLFTQATVGSTVRYGSGFIATPVVEITDVLLSSASSSIESTATSLSQDKWVFIPADPTHPSGPSQASLVLMPGTGESFIGKTLVLKYRAMPVVETVGSYLTSDARDITSDIIAVPSNLIKVSISGLGSASAVNIVQSLINEKHVGEDLSAAEIHQLLSAASLSPSAYPLVLRAYRRGTSGRYDLLTEAYSITPDRTEKLIAGDLSA